VLLITTETKNEIKLDSNKRCVKSSIAHNTNRRRSSQMKGERECKLTLGVLETHTGIGCESWSGYWSSQEWMDRKNEMGGPRIWRRRGSSLAGAVAWERWGGSLGRGAREGASQRAREGERERGVSVWGRGFRVLDFEIWKMSAIWERGWGIWNLDWLCFFAFVLWFEFGFWAWAWLCYYCVLLLCR
jgi:hypothetical protein